jgi:hypothetical protein
MSEEPLQDDIEPDFERLAGFWAAFERAEASRHEELCQASTPRWYETTAIDLSGAAFRIVGLPPDPSMAAKRRLGLVDAFGIAHQIAFQLDLEAWTEPSVNDLMPILLAMRPDRAATYSGPLRRSSLELHDWGAGEANSERGPARIPLFATYLSDIDPSLLDFAARVATEPLCPVESSPLRAISLATLLRTAGNGAVVAYSGISHHLYLILAVPVGVIVMGGARGIAAGLEEGLHRRLVQALTGRDPGTPETDEDQQAEDHQETSS